MPTLKSLFETPKKARLTVGCLLVALATLAAMIYVVCVPREPGPAAGSSGAPSGPVSGAPGESVPPGESAPLMGVVPTLTMDEARALALDHAGVSEEEAGISRETLEEDNGVWVYAFHFRTENAQYEYKINANTGEIRSMIREVFPGPVPETARPSASPLPSGSMAPADSTPPAETDPQPSAGAQPAQSGDPADPSPSPDPSQPASMYIGGERARSIALDHAGLTASQVIVTGTVIRRDNGVVIYDIKFRQGQTRYEYKIDAQSGEVLGHETGGE